MPDFEKLNDDQERALEALFEDARIQEPEPSSDLFTRVLADAASQTPQPSPVTPAPKSWLGLGEMFRQFGGLPGASVMTACALFGMVLGYAGPDSVLDLAGLTETAMTSEFDADVDFYEMTDFGFDEGELLQ